MKGSFLGFVQKKCETKCKLEHQFWIFIKTLYCKKFKKNFLRNYLNEFDEKMVEQNRK
jgi:hypothetical protein